MCISNRFGLFPVYVSMQEFISNMWADVLRFFLKMHKIITANNFFFNVIMYLNTWIEKTNYSSTYNGHAP